MTGKGGTAKVRGSGHGVSNLGKEGRGTLALVYAGGREGKWYVPVPLFLEVSP